MANAKSEAPRRIGDFIEGIGRKLDEIEGEDVTVTRVESSMRPMRGEDKPFVMIYIADANGEEVQYHAWSVSLYEKIGDIPAEAFPLTARFFRTATSGGFQVWNVE